MSELFPDGFPVLVERRLKMRRSASDVVQAICVEVGFPYWIESGIDAACPVAIRGDIGRVNDIHGIDPLGAMKQALDFVEKYLTGHEKKEFFWPDDEPY